MIKQIQTRDVTLVYTKAPHTIKVKRVVTLRPHYTGTKPGASSFKTKKISVPEFQALASIACVSE